MIANHPELALKNIWEYCRVDRQIKLLDTSFRWLSEPLSVIFVLGQLCFF